MKKLGYIFIGFFSIAAMSTESKRMLNFGADVIKHYNDCGHDEKVIEAQTHYKDIGLDLEVALGLHEELIKKLESNYSSCSEYVKIMSAHIDRMNEFEQVMYASSGCVNGSTLITDTKALIAKYPNQAEGIFYTVQRMSRKPLAFVEKVESCDDVHEADKKLIKKLETTLMDMK